MATTYVYAATSIPEATAVSLQLLGPKNLTSAKLERSRLEPKSPRVRLVEVPRILDPGLYCLELSFASAPPAQSTAYVASLQILLSGHGLGSTIWWRWRAAQAAVGWWATDEKTYEAVVCLGVKRYRFGVKGAKTFGYDDVHVGLDLV